MRALASSVALLALLLLLPLSAPAQQAGGAGEPAAAKPKPWDQAAVADLAGQLAAHSDEMRQAVRQQSGTENVASSQNFASREVIQLLRNLRNQCNQLKLQVEGGAGRDETIQAFRRIDQTRRDAGQRLRKMFLTQENIDRVKAGRELVEQLRLYYTGEVDTSPGLVGPSRSENQGGSKSEKE